MITISPSAVSAMQSDRFAEMESKIDNWLCSELPRWSSNREDELRSHELVIEALANCHIGAGKNDLTASAQSFCSSRHQSFTPAHPHTEIGDIVRTDGEAQVKSKIFVDDRNDAQSWFSIWPFSGQRTKRITVSGSACGHTYVGCNVPPAPALSDLSMQLVVMPHEEWSLKVKDLKSSFSSAGSYKKEINAAANVAEGDSFASVKKTVKLQSGKNAETTVVNVDGAKSSSYSKKVINEDNSDDSYSIKKSAGKVEESISYTDKNGLTESYKETSTDKSFSQEYSLSQKKDYPLQIGSSAYSITEKESLDLETSDSSKSPLKEKNKISISDKISIEFKSGGEVSKFQPGALLDGFYKLENIFSAIKDVLKSCRVGAGFSADYKFLYGDLGLTWGYRWPVSPKNYKEEDRVYYVERFVSASGTLNVLTGSIGGWIGIDFDQGWLPAGVKAIVEGTITASFVVTPKFTLSATNLKSCERADASFEIEPEFKITPKFEGTGSARVLGYRKTTYVKIEGSFEAKSKMRICFSDSPSLKASVEWKGVKLTGYFYNSERDPPRKDFEPIVLAKPSTILKETEFWS